MEKTPLPPALLEEWRPLAATFEAALNDDLNTAQALGQIFSQVRIINRLLEDSGLRAGEEARALLQEFLGNARDWDAQLGLFGQEPETFLHDLRTLRARRRGIDLAQVEALLEERRAARAAKDFDRSDALRQNLQELGVSVRDTPEGQVWDLE